MQTYHTHTCKNKKCPDKGRGTSFDYYGIYGIKECVWRYCSTCGKNYALDFDTGKWLNKPRNKNA